jgi:hypothetical protein
MSLNAVESLPAVEATLNYLAPTAERPRSYAYEPPSGEPWTTIVNSEHQVPIHDARVNAAEFSLDRHGFGLVEHRSAVHDFHDNEEVKRVYYPEAEALLKAVTGASRVFIFDHTTRRRVPGTDGRRNIIRQPVNRVHVDHTAKSGPQRVRDLLAEEAQELLRGRVQIINLWRPIRGPLIDAPLAVCDARTVAFDELVPTDLIYQHRVGETYSVRHSPAHRWYFYPHMRVDEVLLLKCYDSEIDGRARFAPHTAFNDPGTPDHAPPRESIELRTLVFHDAPPGAAS